MKLSFLIILLTVTALSCKKGDLPFNLNDGPWNEWCGKNVAFYGDSFTYAAGYWPLPFHFAVSYLSDTIIIGDHPTASGIAYGGYLLHNSAYNGGVPGETSTQIADRYLADQQHTDEPLVIWIGRNNKWDTVTIDHDIDRMIAHMDHPTWYVVLPILTGNWETEYRGSEIWKQVTAFNEHLRLKHGPHFIDIKAMLASRAQHTYSDSEDVANDVTPGSLRAVNPVTLRPDELHLNNDGEQAVADAIIKGLMKCN